MNKLTLRGEEKGFAALLVAMVIVTVIALLTVGFAQLMRNEVSQSLNRQLSNQAFYAAESGINDAVKALSLDPTVTKDKCPPLTAAEASGSAAKQFLRDNIIDGTNTQWTCLLIDSSPGSLVYGNVDRLSPTTFNVSAVDSAGNPKSFGDLTIYWQDASPTVTNFRPNSGTASNAVFPRAGGGPSTSTQWGNATGMLRISMTDISPSGSYTRQGLIDNTFTAFLYPATQASSGPNSIGFNTVKTQQGNVVDGRCNTANTPRYCSVRVTGIGASQLMFTMRSIYSDTSVYITANPSTELTGAQSLVDSTGRSQDTLKRVQVRIPSKGQFYLPGFDLEAVGGVCKQLNLTPGAGSTDGCPY